jgi:hypothetical protein
MSSFKDEQCDYMRENGRTVGGEKWQEKVYNKEEWKKLLRTARNRCILHMPMEWNGICDRTDRTSLSVIHLMYFVQSICNSFREVEYIWYKVQGKRTK